MDTSNWLTALGQEGRLFVQSIPDAFWLAYYWAKEWQIFLGGTLVLIAAQIYAQASVRSARIRAAASIRAAQIATGVGLNPDVRPLQPSPRAKPISPTRQLAPHAVEPDLAHKLEQLRSLIRSAMASLGADVDGPDATGNIYFERIARLRFEEKDLPTGLSTATLELYKKLLLQLSTVRRAKERGSAQADLSEALFQLNARARELVSAMGVVPPAARLGRPEQMRG